MAMSYGEKAVGLTFNPSGDENVDKIKKLYAEIIDLCNDKRQVKELSEERAIGSERNRLFSIAITEAQAAQMWAVKAITWRD